MEFADRIAKVPPYLFVELNRKIAERKAQGADIVNFSQGDPDLPTPDDVIARLRLSALDPANHRYPDTAGLAELRKAIADWCQRRFGLSLDPANEVLPLIGAKEGVGHAALCFIDPGDIALVPDPGYPVYSVGTLFAGGECHWMPLLEENGWLPDLEAIPPEVARRAKVMWLNYPNNPTGAVAERDYFEKVVDFAKRYDVPVIHDACYTEVAYDGYQPVSFLQTPGAVDVGIEIHSLSKSYNMTGWRIGMAVGNAEMINALMVVKSNLDSGIPQAIQEMGIAALSTPPESIRERVAIYQRRRDRLVDVLRSKRIELELPKASLYIWARVPEGYTSAGFAGLLLEEREIVVTPGNGFGPHGEGYFRISLTVSDQDLEKAVKRLTSWDIPPP